MPWRGMAVFLLLAAAATANAGPCEVSTSNASGAGSLSQALDKAAHGDCRTALSETLRKRYDSYVPVTPSIQLIRIPKSATIALTQALPELRGVNAETLILMAESSATVTLSGAALKLGGSSGNVIIDGIGFQGFSQTPIDVGGRDNLLMAVRVSESGSATAPALRVLGQHNAVVESMIHHNAGDGIAVDDGLSASQCAPARGRLTQLIQNTIHDNTGAGLRLHAPEVIARDNHIHHNQGPGVRVTSAPGNNLCAEAASTLYTAELRKNKIHDNADGIVISSSELVPPVDLVEVSAATDDHYRLIGNIGRNPKPNYPWSDSRLNLAGGVVEIFLGDSAKSRQTTAYITQTKILDVKSRQFMVTIPKPIIVDGHEIAQPIFLATFTDPEHHNTSRYSDPLDVAATQDWDRDGVPNSHEDAVAKTDPRLTDSDGDGLTDGTELLHRPGLEEMLKWAIAAEKARNEEKLMHDPVASTKNPFESLDLLDPTHWDSDGDCLPDGLELGITESQWPKPAQAEYSVLAAPALQISSGCREQLKDHQLYEKDLDNSANDKFKIQNILLRNSEAPATLANLIGIFDTDPDTHTDPTHKDSDGDGLDDGAEDWNWDGMRNSELPLTPSTPLRTGPTLSPGERGNWLEPDPNLADSDSDGLPDGEEDELKTSPLATDSDQDGVPDAEEVKQGGSPTTCDSDGDGLPDGIEANLANHEAPEGCAGAPLNGTNFANPYVLSNRKVDSDGDGLKDGEEDANHNGWLDPAESDPTTPDTDGDGISDYVEMTGDLDHDSIADFFVEDMSNGPTCSPPTQIYDADCDGLSNAQDSDSDNDGCADAAEGVEPGNDTQGTPAAYNRENKHCGANGSGAGSGGGGPGSSPGAGSKPAEADEGAPTADSETGTWNAAWAGRTDGGGDCSLIRHRPPETPCIWLFFLAALIPGVLVSARVFLQSK